MDWTTNLVLPPNYVSLQHLKDLRMKEKAEAEKKLREEAEAEYRLRLQEELRLKRIKEEEERKRVEEEERVKRLKEEEEKKRVEEEERVNREKEEEERLRKEIVKREQIIKTRRVLCGESSGSIRRSLKKLQEEKQKEEIKEEIKDEIFADKDDDPGIKEDGVKGKRNRWRKWGEKKKGVIGEETLELESEIRVYEKTTPKSIEEEEVIPNAKPIRRNGRQRRFGSKDEIFNQKFGSKDEQTVMNEKGVTETTETQSIGGEDVILNAKPSDFFRRQRNFGSKDDKVVMNQKGVTETTETKSETKSIEEEEVIPNAKPNDFIRKNRRQRKFGSKDGNFDKVVINQKGVTEATETRSIGGAEDVIPNARPIRKNRRQRKLESEGGSIAVDKIVMNQKVEEIEDKFGDLNVDVVDDKKKRMPKPKAERQFFPQPQMSYIDRYPHSQIKNYSRYGKRIDSAMNPRNAAGSSSLVWVAKTDEKQIGGDI